MFFSTNSCNRDPNIYCSAISPVCTTQCRPSISFVNASLIEEKDSVNEALLLRDIVDRITEINPH